MNGGGGVIWGMLIYVLEMLLVSSISMYLLAATKVSCGFRETSDRIRTSSLRIHHNTPEPTALNSPPLPSPGNSHTPTNQRSQGPPLPGFASLPFFPPQSTLNTQLTRSNRGKQHHQQQQQQQQQGRVKQSRTEKAIILSLPDQKSDADSDVLADYVLALLRHEQTQEEVQKLCIEQLDDFLHDHTAQFVKDVFATLGNQSFKGVNSTLTGAPQPQQSQQQQQQSQPQNSRPSISPVVSLSPLVSAGSVADNRAGEIRGIKRERSHFERDREGSSGRDTYSPNTGSARGYKAPRRGGAPSGPGRWNGGNGNGGGGGGHVGGGGPGRGGISGGNAYGHPQGSAEIPFPPPGGPPVPPAIPQFGMPPMPPPGFPWVVPGPGDPMGAYLAAQAAAVAWGGFPPIGKSDEGKKVVKKVGERCKDYDVQGYCMKGDMCPYDHGMNPYVVEGGESSAGADEYDPNNSQLFSADPSTTTQNNHSNNNNKNSSRGHGENRGRGRGRGNRGGGGGNRGGRSELSGTGPSYDRSNTTLVVEHIPDDKLEESAIKAFFSEFGNVLKVDVTPNKQLATVKFERWDMARKAYDSPAPIFDNRFVKVFWYKPNAEQNGTAAVAAAAASKQKEPSPVADEMEIDMEEFKKKQEEAQKAHEAKMLKKKANEEAAKELERRKEELQRMQLEEKRKLEEKLAKKLARSAATSASPPASGPSPAPEDAKAAITAALEAQLRSLEAEAQSLGIEGSDSGAPEYGTYRGRGRGRFPFRARGGYVPRGRGAYVPTYGSYRGRGAFPAARGRGGTLKLDNRTRKVTVSAADLRGGKDEEFRHYLMNTGLEVEGIEPHPEQDDMQIVTFKDRRTAEKFIYTGNDIPNVGEVTLAWFNSASTSNPSPNKSEDPNRMDTTEENNNSTTHPSSSAAASSSSTMHHHHHHHINANDPGDDDVYEDDEGRWLPE
ncbi:hypothetical protein L873DRAFT_1842571 [Choiromyces venosus 120613-1]|uniref:C3H1-type domain-containing protein n=1 Tax=Choiromyces venosus 120613-1 TaxID=1336337 RepID=A0A3N4JSC7_9PEZI|nr:hypothetical protein L873DRAFT_1842571 [Choiromyces venosus 120613-1]